MPKSVKSKKESGSRLVVTQSLWVDSMTLTLDREVCIGCDLCRQVCPKEAVALSLTRGDHEFSTTPDIDEQKCSMCGLCVAFCPVNAVRLVTRNTWKGTESEVSPILDVGGVPHFSKGMELDASLCPPGCDLCANACPRQALLRSEGGVTLDRERCLSCAHCEAVCPVPGAAKVTRLFDGAVEVDVDGCPEGCELCLTACPTRCYTALSTKGVEVDPRHCICCGACLVACPHGAIDLTRLRLHCAGDGFSAVWSRAVDRLLSENSRFLQQNETNYVKLTEMLRRSRS